MLGKLLKYELKATSRAFLPFLGAILILSVINKLSMALDAGGSSWITKTPQSVLMFLYIAMIVAASVFCIILTVQRFYKGLLGQEGYLMFTLPVSSGANILSKGITAMIWMIATVLVTFASILIYLPGTGFLPLLAEQWTEAVREVQLEAGLNLNHFLLFMLLITLVGCCASILEIYAAMSIGQLANNHRLLCSFGAYLAINMAKQILATIVMNLFLGPILLNGLGLDASMMIVTSDQVGVILYTVFGSALAMELLFGGAGFFVSRWLLKAKLNLE